MLGCRERFPVAEVEACRLHAVRCELRSDEVEFRFGVLRVGRCGKSVDEGLEGFVGFAHVDLRSFDVLDILEVDESFQVERVGERGRGGVGLDEGFDFDERFDLLFLAVVGEGEQDLRSGSEFRVGVVVRDDLEIFDGLFVVLVSEGACSCLEVLLDLLLGEAGDGVAFVFCAGGREGEDEGGEQGCEERAQRAEGAF